MTYVINNMIMFHGNKILRIFNSHIINNNIFHNQKINQISDEELI
jgi:hypothetical protein